MSRTELLIFGWIRINFNLSIPQEIKFECIKMILFIDKWEIENKDIYKNQVIVNGTFQKTSVQIVAATQKKFVFIFGIHKPKHIQILVIE